MRPSTFKKIVVTLFMALLVFGGVVLFVQMVVVPRITGLSPFGSTVLVSFHEHFSLDAEVTELVFGGRRMRDASPPLVEYRGGLPRVYLNANFLRNHIDPFVFWDEGAGVLFFSTQYELVEFSPGSEFFLINGSPQPIENGIIERDGEIFVPASVVQGLYPLIVDYKAAYNIVVVSDATAAQTTARVGVDSADIHYFPNSRPITAVLGRGETLVIFADADEFEGEYEYTGAAASDFVRVRTPNGLLGYVRITDISDLHTATPADSLQRNTILQSGFVDNNSHPPKVWQGTGAINVIWEIVNNNDANVINMQTPLHSSLTAVSPTWFRIDETGTHLYSFASREYVNWAHSQGVEVWAKVFDVNNARARRFLKNRDARQTAVAQLVEYVEQLNLDGLNIDFEHLLNADEGPYKIQFLRELAIPMRQRGITLSAAVKVPITATTFYRRDLIAKTVDFVMLMAYDEHWSTSPVAGPNASLPWVQNAVHNMLNDFHSEQSIPPERLVLGLPFYNRIWRSIAGTGEVSHYRALGTLSTRAFFEERGGTWVWDDNYASYRGEASAFEGGEAVIFRVWLECARSIQEKMHVFEDNNLAGVAIWSRLFAIDEFWEVLARYF
ncbi:MAG: glycosyl hydrolase family 18 protein [Defluviitaleaceae bacterium]|nr:glycosyl hydrolase family 18 protein [Defluviitaleaceae bacterium]MCL2264315.1 glycosyl hydrolase family 18 protein [Defluviitaleaceae bacterium]